MILAELEDNYSWSADLHKEKEQTENIFTWCQWQERSNLACAKPYAKSHNLELLYIGKHTEFIHF